MFLDIEPCSPTFQPSFLWQCTAKPVTKPTARTAHGRVPAVLIPSASTGAAVTYFRPRRPGPEADLEDQVAAYIPRLFAFSTERSWAARSVPIGAGMPDLVIAAYDPEVIALASAEITDTNILA